MSVFFIGHHDAPPTVYPRLKEAIQRCILQNGADEFFAGGYGQFDAMASRALVEWKNQYPSIRIFRLPAYYSPDHPPILPSGFDGSFFPPGLESVPHHAAIPHANRYMVDHADILIAYVRFAASNSRTLLEYAKKREQQNLIRIINLADE